MDNNSNSIAHSEPIPVSDFMTVTVITATENQNVRDVCKLMYDKKNYEHCYLGKHKS